MNECFNQIFAIEIRWNRTFRMRYYGFNPLKKLVTIRHQQTETAEEHYSYTLILRTFHLWFDNVQQDIQVKTKRADDFYRNLLYRRYLTSWKRYRHQSEIAEERAERHYLSQLLIRSFKNWQDSTQSEIIRRWRLEDVAKEHDVKRLLKMAFLEWRKYPAERRKEREREKRLTEMRMRVKDLIPDFRGSEVSTKTTLNDDVR